MRVAVVGTGLIGGSIALACRQRLEARVCGFDPDSAAMALALQRGAVDETAEDVAGALRGAEAAFVACPVGVLGEVVAEVLRAAAPSCVVSDAGSTKRAVVAAAAGDERFVGGHPLAGAETAGVEHARADLFEGASWYLTPVAGGASGVLYERLHRIVVGLGAQPVVVDADVHDRMMGVVSHLPHVLANVLALQGAGALGGERMPPVGPSFRDATRVAGSNSRIWVDIYRANGDVLVEALDETMARLSEARALLQSGDPEAIGAWNEEARVRHGALLGAGADGAEAGLIELRCAVPNRPGVVADIALALGGAGVNIVDLALAPSPDNSQGVVALWVRGPLQADAAERLIGGLSFPVARVAS